MDCGLSAPRRELLSPHVTLVAAPEEPGAVHAQGGPAARPAGGDDGPDRHRRHRDPPAGPLISDAAEGRWSRSRTTPTGSSTNGRSCSTWRPWSAAYLCSGLVALGREQGEAVLELVEDREPDRLRRSYFGDHDPGYPLLYADQDVLNAVLASRLDAERVVALDHRLAPMTRSRASSWSTNGGSAAPMRTRAAVPAPPLPVAEAVAAPVARGPLHAAAAPGALGPGRRDRATGRRGSRRGCAPGRSAGPRAGPGPNGFAGSSPEGAGQ